MKTLVLIISATALFCLSAYADVAKQGNTKTECTAMMKLILKSDKCGSAGDDSRLKAMINARNSGKKTDEYCVKDGSKACGLPVKK